MTYHETVAGIIFSLQHANKANEGFYDLLESVPRLADVKEEDLHSTIGRFLDGATYEQVLKLDGLLKSTLKIDTSKPVSLQFTDLRIFSESREKVYVVLRVKDNDTLNQLAKTTLSAAQAVGIKLDAVTVEDFENPKFHVTIDKFWRNKETGDQVIDDKIEDLGKWIEPDQFKDQAALDKYISDLNGLMQGDKHGLDDVTTEGHLFIMVAGEDYEIGKYTLPETERDKFYQIVQLDSSPEYAKAYNDMKKLVEQNPTWPHFYISSGDLYEFRVAFGQSKIVNTAVNAFGNHTPWKFELAKADLKCQVVSPTRVHVVLLIPLVDSSEKWCPTAFFNIKELVAGQNANMRYIVFFKKLREWAAKQGTDYMPYVTYADHEIQDATAHFVFAKINVDKDLQSSDSIKPLDYILELPIQNFSQDERKQYIKALDNFKCSVSKTSVNVKFYNKAGEIL